MSNYSQTTFFGPKDSLPSGNPAKIILGAQYDVEFSALSIAIGTKVDGTSVFFPNGSAGTPSVGFTSNAGTGLFNAAGVLGFATGSTSRATLSAAGGFQLGSPTGGDKGVSTLNAAGNLYVNGVPLYQTGSFTATITGMTAGTTATCNYVIVGNTVTVQFPTASTGTSNTTAMTVTGVPAAIQPASVRSIVACLVEDNSANVPGFVDIVAGSGTWTFLRMAQATAIYTASNFTAAGAKGLNGTAFTYLLL